MRRLAVFSCAFLVIFTFSETPIAWAQGQTGPRNREAASPPAADSPADNPLRNSNTADALDAPRVVSGGGVALPSPDIRRAAEFEQPTPRRYANPFPGPAAAPAQNDIPPASAVGLMRPDGARYAESQGGGAENQADGEQGSPVAPFAGSPNPTTVDRYPPQSPPNLLPNGEARLADQPPVLNAPGTAASPVTQASSFPERRPEEVSTGTAKPGDPRLEGEQTPQLAVEKIAPEEVQVGKTAVFRTTVRNTGQITAHEVEIHDLVPQGMRLVGTTPEAKQGLNGEIIWELGRLRPGDEQTVEAHFMPVSEGDLGSVATVQFQAIASAKTRVTRPMLHLETRLPESVLIGEEAAVSIIVSNPGTGIATGVVIEEIVPQGFEHEAGRHLEYEVGTLKPGESRTLDLTLKAIQPGPGENRLNARGEGGLFTEDKRPINVISPALDIALEGPGRRFLEREATYTVSVSNPGTAPARQVELVAYLPQGMKFVKADNAGQYDPKTRTVRWNLEELPAQESGAVALTAIPIEPGSQNLRVSGAARLVPPVEKEQPVLVEGVAAILFEVGDLVDPIEVGGETTYQIRVVNQGTKAATDVEVVCVLPPELQFVTAEGPTAHRSSANQVSFEMLPELGPKAETTYRIRVRGAQSGDQRIRVLLQTGQMQTPVTKEESTRVFSDQ